MEMALLVDDECVQYYVDSMLEVNWQNRVVIGQVSQVVKNLKAAFVDYGLNKNGMLHFKQIPDVYQGKIQQGYSLPVQITKQNIGEKGHKLTAKLNMTGKYLVCLPFEPGIHVSKKVNDPAKRDEIKSKLEVALDTSYGFIVRTHASEVAIEEVIEDAKDLITKVKALLETSPYLTKGSVLYEEPSVIYQMIMEEVIKRNELEIICDDKNVKEEIRELVNHYGDLSKVTIHYEEDDQNLFSIYGISKKIEQLLKRKIWLKNGGNLILVGRSQDKLDIQAKEVSSKYGVEVDTIAVDLSKDDAAAYIFDACTKKNVIPDIIINNAGFGGQGDFARERTMEQDMSMLSVKICINNLIL